MRKFNERRANDEGEEKEEEASLTEPSGSNKRLEIFYVAGKSKGGGFQPRHVPAKLVPVVTLPVL